MIFEVPRQMTLEIRALHIIYAIVRVVSRHINPENCKDISRPPNLSLIWGEFSSHLPRMICHLLPRKFTSSPLKSYLPNRKVVFQPSFFRGYVKLRGCIVTFSWNNPQMQIQLGNVSQVLQNIPPPTRRDSFRGLCYILSYFEYFYLLLIEFQGCK